MHKFSLVYVNGVKLKMNLNTFAEVKLEMAQFAQTECMTN